MHRCSGCDQPNHGTQPCEQGQRSYYPMLDQGMIDPPKVRPNRRIYVGSGEDYSPETEHSYFQ